MRVSLAPANESVQQPASNAEGDADNIGYPVVKVGAAVEAGLDEFNGAAEGARAYEDRQQPEATRAGQREGECGKGYEVHQLVAALRRRGRRLQGPKHRDGQGERHGDCQGDVEVLAHPPGCIDLQSQWQAWASVGCIRG